MTSKSRMKTGVLHKDGKEYFLNDGTCEDIPVGALVEESLAGPGSTEE